MIQVTDDGSLDQGMRSGQIFYLHIFIKVQPPQEFPGGLVVRILGFHCHGPGSVPGWGAEILQAMCCDLKKKKKKKIQPPPGYGCGT